MHGVFRRILADFQEAELPAVTRRELVLPELPEKLRKALTFIGMRRSGKTYLLFQLIGDLLAAGVAKRKILYVNFADDRLAGMGVGDFQALLDVFHEVSGEGGGKRYFFLDEIQEVKGWEKFIRRLLDTEECEVYLTGSSAKLLSTEIASSLRGRSLTREVFPFSFREYLHHKGIALPELPSTKQRAQLAREAASYMTLGGFPESVGLDPLVHEELLQGYMESVIYRDIVERYDVRNITVLRRFMAHCLQNSGGLLSVNKMTSDFKSQGLSLSKNTLYEYLTYLEDAYSLFSVRHFNLSQRKSTQKPRKLYPVDSGLVHAYSLLPENSTASAFESAVFAHLRRQADDVFYFHTEDNREVDFLLPRRGADPLLIQACVTLDDPRTRQREITALESAMRQLNVPSGLIVTLDREETLSVPSGHIECIPLWQFLLTELSKRGLTPF